MTREDHDSDDIAALKHAKDMDNHVAKFAEYFKITLDAYKQSLKSKYNIDSLDPWVLFVIEEKERNVTEHHTNKDYLMQKYYIGSYDLER